MVLKKTIAAVLLCLGLVGLAKADWLFVGNGVSVILMEDTECTEFMLSVADGLLPVDIAEWNKARVFFEGREIDACWVPWEGAAAIVDAEGHGGMIPADKVQRVKSM